METSKLKRVKRAIERFFYSIKFNIALHKVYSSPKHRDFRKKIRVALEKQIIYYSKVEKVEEILGVRKAVQKLTKKVLRDNLILIWAALSEFLEKEDLENYLLEVANKAGQSALNKLGSDEVFKLTNKTLINNIRGRVGVVFGEVDKTTQDWIARTVEEGIKAKKNNVEIAKQIRSEAKRVALVRADVIAEFEAATVLGAIELEVYKRNKVQFHKWVTSRDEKVCPRCDANQGANEVPVGDKFPTGAISPPDHIRCRCFTLPIVPLDFKVKWQGK